MATKNLSVVFLGVYLGPAEASRKGEGSAVEAPSKVRSNAVETPSPETAPEGVK